MIPLYKPYMPDYLPEIEGIIKSGKLSYGEWGRSFEKALGDYLDNHYILTVNSFNSAMLVAITTMGLKPGDEVIASPMSCLASNQPFATQNIKVVWADIDPETGTLCPDSVISKITSKTKAIFHNHFCGYVGYIEEINKIGKENGIFVVDDAIEAFGSKYKNCFIGNTETPITVFSFQTVRLPNTIDGGAIAFKDKALYEKAILVRDYGITRENFRDNMGEISPDCDIKTPGFGALMNEVSSYIGYEQMKDLNNLFSLQKKNANEWEQYLLEANISGKSLQKISNASPNYWVYGILADDKEKTIKKFRDMGFYASGVHLSNNKYSVFGKTEHLPGVSAFDNSFVAIPSGWWFEKHYTE